MPGVVLQQLFPELSVGCEEQPVLGQNDARGSPLGAEPEAPFQEDRGQVVFRFRVPFFAKLPQRVVLPAPGKIGDVGDHQVVLPRHQGSGLRQPLGHHSSLLPLFASFAPQGLLHQAGEVFPPDKIRRVGLRRVEKASQNGRILENVVDPAQGQGEVLPSQAELFPLLPGHGHREAGTGKVKFRQGPVPPGAGAFPRGQGQGEGGDLGHPPVDVQAVDVLPQHGIRRIFRR
ncbi:hypothetical protein SDC9_50277 [bioreactor metagenome]|uniref:Uncharacterized protein n=1 Tax=bioreactor metagenome TaxID=1076179 RepID=A0A644WJR2_9ZZZZ